MKNLNKIHTLTGWGLFLIAFITYTATVEPTASFWDSGEFISSAYTLQIPHAPGAPLYSLVGHMFSYLAIGDQTQVAFWINMVSVISSALTIMLLYWIIVMLGRKLFNIEKGQETRQQFFLLALGGAIGALAYTFSDSFWFSAVEAEVYAFSSFLSALVVWAILRWDLIENNEKSNKWLIFIAYLIGLSIGVHPLNILAVPSVCLVYYFKKYKTTKLGLFYTLVLSGALIILLMFGLRLGLVGMAKNIEIFSVNVVGLPFGSGAVFFSLLVIVALVYGIIYSIKRQRAILNTALLGVVYLLIGFGSYGVIIIRSNFDPPLDPNNPENLPNFVAYLNLEQYPTRPLFYGPNYTADIIGHKNLGPAYVKGDKKYETPYNKFKYLYDPAQTSILPRIYSREDNHVQGYKSWLGLKDGQRPTFGDNLRFMVTYQLGYMYWRYFLWNFSGRESDIEGAKWLAPWAGNEGLPHRLTHNKGRNNYLMLPLLLGLLGFLFNVKKDFRSFSIIGILFLVTGVILVLYLNAPPSPPRERDYIYVGSFLAFAIWIGFGAMALMQYLQKLLKKPKLSFAVASALSLAIPGIMLVENWDDHNRSNRYYSVDSAINTLESCPPNAILFTGGDNDTYPLWYAQEVEGIRKDVRVVVSTYFTADWNLEQMTRPSHDSEPLPFSFEKENFRRGVNDYVYVRSNPKFDSGIDLRQYLKLVKNEHPALIQKTPDGDRYTVMPSKKFVLNVDRQAILEKGIVPAKKINYLQDSMEFVIKGNGFHKGDLMQLDLIANNNWERPVCYTFTATMNSGIEFGNYLVQQGQTFRLLPLKNPDPQSDFIDTDTMYTNLMEKSQWRGLDDTGVYYSDYYKGQMRTPRNNFNNLAEALLAEGDRKRAEQVLNQSLSVIPDDTIPYDVTTTQTVSLLLDLDRKEKAAEIADTMMERADRELTYYFDNKTAMSSLPIQENLFIMNYLTRAFRMEGSNESAARFEEMFMKFVRRIEGRP